MKASRRDVVTATDAIRPILDWIAKDAPNDPPYLICIDADTFDGVDAAHIENALNHPKIAVRSGRWQDWNDVYRNRRLVTMEWPLPDLVHEPERSQALDDARALLDRWRAVAQPLVGSVNAGIVLVNAEHFGPSDLIAVIDAADLLAGR